MRYMGGKDKLSKRISTSILEARKPGQDTYLEPFVGGASVLAKVAPHFTTALAGDTVEDLILLWEAARDGWVPPLGMTKDEYESLKLAPPSALRGFAAFGMSYSGKRWAGWTPNLPTRKWDEEASRGVVRKASSFANVTFACRSYSEWTVDETYVIYCDPPYDGTTEYPGAPGFNSAAFWQVAEEWVDKGATVLVSEYGAPDGWVARWSKDVPVSLRPGGHRTRAIESLWVPGISSDHPWDDDLIQFARLISEIEATQTLDIDALCESMDLSPADVTEIIDRAQSRWEGLKP